MHSKTVVVLSAKEAVNFGMDEYLHCCGLGAVYLSLEGPFQGCSNLLYSGSSTDPGESPDLELVCTV